VPFINKQLYDLIILTVKSHQTKEAVDDIKDYVKDNTIILSMQNGVDNGEVINRYVPRNNIILAVLKVGLFINYDDVVVHSFGGPIKIGCYKKLSNKDNLQRLSTIFKKAGITCIIEKDVKKALWEKALWNAAFNPLSTVLKKTCGQLLEEEKIKLIMKNLMYEVIEAAIIDNIYIDEKSIEENLKVDELMKTFKTSMLQDIEALKKPEIDGMLLPIIRRLEGNGNYKSYHRLLYNIIDCKYGKPFIYTPRIAADTIIINSNKEILLIKRKNPPYGWAIHGGFDHYN
jgi:2-dehydropantoate 2-reductase